MKAKLFFSILLVTFLATSFSQKAMAHCQVPCGIFADQLRFEAMLEDQTTIAKANGQMAELLKESTPLAANQATRWILTKEDHCSKIMETVAEYFMAQRIKPDAENYEKTLVAAHNVMRAAMKAKQDPSAEVAEALKTSILELYESYEGKAFQPHTH
ncbi:MAG: superoxide dismutase [Ni] [Verrucomicrobiales bacterium]|nr:superoxide dismutase [Ni] [Verrucomicrobiales bacterium]